MLAYKKLFHQLIWSAIAMALCYPNTYAQNTTRGWKAGVAKVKITPEHDMWMAGYAARDKPERVS